MKRLASRDLRRLSEFLLELYAFRDLDGFVRYALARLPRVVGSELTMYGEIYPRRRRFQMVDEPSDVRSALVKRAFEEFAHEHPFFHNYRGGGDGSAVRISDLLSLRRFQRLALYNESFRPTGINYEIVVWLPAPAPIEITFALHRAKSDFTESDRQLLNMLRPHLIQSHRNAEAVTLFRQAIQPEGRPALLVDPSGRASDLESHHHTLLAQYFDYAARPGKRLPDRVLRWLKQQEALLRRADDLPPVPEPLVVEQHGKRLTVRLFAGPTQRLLLFEERFTVADPRSLEPLGLSRREAEVLGWVAQGKTNEEIGTILGLSGRTIAKHLERMYPRLGVENRTAAAARALEVLSSPANNDHGRRSV